VSNRGDFSNEENVKQADRALLSFKEVADKLGVEWCLFAGTALGFFRNKGYINWDNDIDIALTGGEAALDKVSTELYQIGFNIGRDCTNNDGTRNRHLWGGMETAHDTESGILVDVFYTFTDTEKQFLHSFEAIDYKGRLFLIPRPIKRYLIETYGKGFMVPQKGIKAKYEPERKISYVNTR